MTARIPGRWLGILFLWPAFLVQASSLSAELFEQEQWLNCRREALREGALSSTNALASLHYAAAGLRGHFDTAPALDQLHQLALDHSNNSLLVSRIHFELGRHAWMHGLESEAWPYLIKAFAFSPKPDVYRPAGCMLYLMHRKQPNLAEDKDRAYVNQVKTLRPLWTAKRIEALLKDREAIQHVHKRSILGIPNTWIVKFYRSQISPAIGSRCSLHPSCSEYFMQASKKHGLLSIPLIGDRLAREPGVVQAAEQSTWINGEERILDPLHDHVH